MENNKEFDQIIRDKMQGFEPSFVPESWDFLEQKMNAQEAQEPDAVPENDVIDQLSYEKLHNYHQPYNKTHWEIMAGKLEREFYFIQELFRVKTMEVSLMLLLLLFLGRLIPGDNYKVPAIHLEDKMIVQSEQHFSTGQDNLAVQAADQVAVSKDIGQSTPGSQPGINSIQAYSPDSQSPALVNSVLFVEQLPANPVRSNTASSFALPALIQTTNSLPVDMLVEQAIAMLETPNPETGLEFKPYPSNDIIVRVGMFGAPNIDHIVNESLIIGGEKIPSLNRYAFGYSGGISLGLGVNRFEVETGIVYTSKRYTPIEVQFVAGTVEKGFRNETFKFFEFNTVSVPFNVRYNFVNNPKWRVYAYGGGAAHFNAQSFYHVGPPELSDENRDETTSTFGGRNSVIEALERELAVGIFQEGEFRENTYLSVNGGLGLERSVGDRWSFFTQSNYQHTFMYDDGGLGPFKDVIHTFSVSTGLKVRVNGGK